MKLNLFLLAGIGIEILLGLWGAHQFQVEQEADFNKIAAEVIALQNKVEALTKDMVFAEHHQKDLDLLNEKGWFSPKSRLIAADAIEKLNPLLNKINYTFEPESQKSDEGKYNFKVTRIVFDVGALADSHIYTFIDNLMESFPGVLIPRELTLEQAEKMNGSNLLVLKQNKRPDFVVGKLVFEWVALRGEENDK